MAYSIKGKGKFVARKRRHLRLRKKINGTPERPRLVVTRSNRHMVAQVIDDTVGHTLVSASDIEADVAGAEGTKTDKARKVGALIGFAWGNTRYHTDVFQTVDMRTLRLNADQRNASDPAALPGDYFNSPTTVPSGIPLGILPAYAQSLLQPGAPIDRAMLLALNPGATLQQIDNGLMGRLPRYLVYTGERTRRGEVKTRCARSL